MVFGPTHTFLRGLASYAFASFWYRVEVHTRVGGLEVEELVPEEGTPVIVVANHWNSAADVSLPFVRSVRGKADRVPLPG